MNPTAQRLADTAPAITVGSSAATVAFWGLQVNEICAIISTVIALIGLLLQVFLAVRRIKKLERQQNATQLAVGAVAHSTQGVAKRVDVIEKSSV